MTEDLILYEGGLLAKADEELLWERVGSHYLELQEKRPGRRVRVAEAVQAVLDAHPGEYVDEVAKASCKGKDFESYLAGRRKEHMLVSLVPTLYAAETGLRLGSMAAEELARRMDSEVAISEMTEKDLLAIMKAGLDYAKEVDKKVEEATGTQDVKVNVDLRGLLLGFPPELASEYMSEVARRIQVEK